MRLDLGEDADVVLMRQDPPFDLGYITATHLLERIAGKTLVVNDPASVRNAPEKVWVLDFARFMPPTLVTRSLDEARAFLAEHGEIVVKPLHGNGGKAIFKVGARRRQPVRADRGVQHRLARAAHDPGIPARRGEGRQAHRAGRWRNRRRDQPDTGRRRDPIEPRGRRLGGEDRTDRKRAAKSAPRSPPNSRRAGCCSSAST